MKQTNLNKTLAYSTARYHIDQSSKPVNILQKNICATDIDLLQKYVANIDNYLAIDVIQKILKKFLIETDMTKEDIAKELDISMANLEDLLYGKSLYLVPKINLPLCQLFCSEIKFNWRKNV